ncbi:MAG: glycoside hydrolase family 18 protein, partial [Planctomycetota bacterium]
MPRLLLLLCGAFAPAMASAERVMVGYFATFGDLPVEQIPWSRLTHVCHGFLRLDPQGEVVTTDAMPNGGLTADGRKNDTPVLVSIGWGKTASGLEKVTASKESTTALLRKVLKVVDEGRYDGIDLAWEYPRDEATRAGHARLVSELRRGLTALAKRTNRDTPYLLTATLTASPFFGQWVDVEAIVPKVDWLNIKAYDMAGPWSRHAAHHAPLFASSDDPEKATRSV